MPEMDGITATDRIREREAEHRQSSAHRRHDRARDEGRPGTLPGRRAWTATSPSPSARRSSTTYWIATLRRKQAEVAGSSHPKRPNAATLDTKDLMERVDGDAVLHRRAPRNLRRRLPRRSCRRSRPPSINGDSRSSGMRPIPLKGALANLSASTRGLAGRKAGSCRGGEESGRHVRRSSRAGKRVAQRHRRSGRAL